MKIYQNSEEMLECNGRDGGCAFPCELELPGGEIFSSMGMTLRDYFAAKSITGYHPGNGFDDGELLDAARRAYRVADAMLKARDR